MYSSSRLQGKWNSSKDRVAAYQTPIAAVALQSPLPRFTMEVEGAAEKRENRLIAGITPWTLLKLHEGQFCPTNFGC